MREDAVGNHVDPARVDRELAGEAITAVHGVHNDRVEALIQTPLGRELARARLAREDIVGREHECSPPAGRGIASREQMTVDVLDREPLKMHDIRRARGAAVAKHVRDVLSELGDTLSAGARGEACRTVEQLTPPVPLRGRHRAVGETAREQLDLCSRRRQRAAQRVVVRGRVGRGIDDVDAHRRRQ